jgi:hypothetical protein
VIVPPPAPAAPATPAPAPVALPAVATPPAVRSLAPAPPARVDAAPSGRAHFALVYGPLTSAEAEQLERTLIRAGHDSLRRRPDPGPTVYAVLIERIPTEHDARALIRALRAQGLGEARIASADPLVVRVGEPRPLRGAVELAERVREAGHQVRVAAERQDRGAYTIRHGRFATRDEAEARSRELAGLRLPAAQVVEVR